MGQVWLPASVAVDGAGNVYSAYSSDYPRRLLKWAPGATDPEVLLDGLTTSFTVSDLFAEADGTLYVADPANKRIFKLEPGSGTPVKVAGGSWGGNDLNNIQHAGSIYVDAAGAMFVLDSGNDRIVKWLP